MVHAKQLSRVRLFETPWTVAHQTPFSMEYSRQEYWRGLHFLLQGSSQPRDGTFISGIFCIGRQILFLWILGKSHHLLN